MSLSIGERERLQINLLAAIAEVDQLFRKDQDMTYVVMCINKKYPDRHVMVTELDFDQIRKYLLEIEENYVD